MILLSLSSNGATATAPVAQTVPMRTALSIVTNARAVLNAGATKTKITAPSNSKSVIPTASLKSVKKAKKTAHQLNALNPKKKKSPPKNQLKKGKKAKVQMLKKRMTHQKCVNVNQHVRKVTRSVRNQNAIKSAKTESS